MNTMNVVRARAFDIPADSVTVLDADTGGARIAGWPQRCFSRTAAGAAATARAIRYVAGELQPRRAWPPCWRTCSPRQEEQLDARTGQLYGSTSGCSLRRVTAHHRLAGRTSDPRPA